LLHLINCMKKNKSILIILIISLGVFFILLFLTTLYFIYHNPVPDDTDRKIQTEIVKSLLELLVVTGIGGIIGLLFKGVERNQEQSRVRTEQRIDFMKRIRNLYLDVKSCRRALIVGGLTNKYGRKPENLKKEDIELYKQQMEIINEKQLELEGLKTETEILHSDAKEEIKGQIDLMEKYLRKIHNEFEKYYTSENIVFDSLSYLQEFTGPTKDKLKEDENELDKYRLKKELSIPYYKVLGILNNQTSR
jgi:hypothetical protein